MGRNTLDGEHLVPGHRHGWRQAMWIGVGAMTVLLIYVLARGPEAVATNEHGSALQAAAAPVDDA